MSEVTEVSVSWYIKTGTAAECQLKNKNDQAIVRQKVSKCANARFLSALDLDLVGQEGKDLLGGGAEDGPAVVGGIWQGHGLSEALQQRAAHGQTLGSEVLLELLQAQTLHVDLELVLSNMLHPQAQTLIQVSPSVVLEGKNRLP